jgi:eukaryotic-like serine/threonine-protein kinase
MALTNRVLLWRARKDVRHAIKDLRATLSIARELGHPQIERWPTFNLAEFLHYLGRGKVALPLAKRAHVLGQRFFREAPVSVDALLLARLAAARGDWVEAHDQISWIEEHVKEELQPGNVVELRMVKLAIEGGGARTFSARRWDELIEYARSVSEADGLLEVLIQAATCAGNAGAGEEMLRLLDMAAKEVKRSPMWKPRIRALRHKAMRPPSVS